MIPGLSDRIKSLRLSLRMSQTKFADEIGVSQPTVSRWEREDDMPDDIYIQLMADLAGTSAAKFRHGDDNYSSTVPHVGYVGAGEEVHIIGEGGMELDRVPAPPDLPTGGLVALTVRGDSMRPIRPGWKVYYRKNQDGVPSDCINELCVIELEDGRMFIKELRLGRRPNRFILHSWAANADPIDDVPVAWAAKVEAILP